MKLKGKLLLMALTIALSSQIIPTKAFAATVRSNQTATAYAGGGKTASGKTPEIGYVAVHYSNGNPLKPVIPFGTYIYIDNINVDSVKNENFVPTSQGEVHVWRVEDTGVCTSTCTTYWLDFYVGTQAEVNRFGSGKVTYRY